MTRATRRDKYIGKTSHLYVAFELGVEEWKLGFSTDLGAKPRVRIMPARDLTRLAREIAAAKQWLGLPTTAVVRSCYEIGRDGFWLHRYLTSKGIDNRVVDSLKHRGEPAPATREVRWPGRRQTAGDVDAVPCGGIEGVERSAGADG